MFSKRAVILTQSIGAPNGPAQKDVMTSLSWLGVSDIRKLGFGLMEGIIWNELSERRRKLIEKKTKHLAAKYIAFNPAHKSLKIKGLFAFSRILHKKTAAMEETPSADNQHWIDNGWIKK